MHEWLSLAPLLRRGADMAKTNGHMDREMLALAIALVVQRIDRLVQQVRGWNGHRSSLNPWGSKDLHIG